MQSILSDIVDFSPILLKGTVVTIELTLISLVIALVLGLFIALGKISHNKILNKICGVYISIFRGTPLLVQLMYVYFVFPELGLQLTAFQAAIVGLAANEAAYLAEIFRAGIQSIPKGQFEAAKSIGMDNGLAMRRIILPQAIRNVLPALSNSAIVLIKNSSLAAVITVTELMYQGQVLSASTFKNLFIFTMVGIIYWILHYPLALLVDNLERRGVYKNARGIKS